jgi:hypothetical protein
VRLLTRRAFPRFSREKEAQSMSSNIIPFPAPTQRRDPALIFFARYIDIQRQIHDPNVSDQRRGRLSAMLNEIDEVMARQVQS